MTQVTFRLEKNNNVSLICSKCRSPIKDLINFNRMERLAFRGKIDMREQFCDKCKNNE